MKGGHFGRPQEVPDICIEDWRRLLRACPIPRKGDMFDGDVLALINVTPTPQLRPARAAGGCMIGGRPFRYVPRHDMLIREDFRAWAVAHREAVLTGGVPAQGKGG